jgi:hypothetical protein
LEPESIHFPEASSGSTADHLDQLAISLPGTTIGIFEGFGQTRPNDRQTANIAEGDQHKEHAQVSAPSARVGSAGWVEQTAVPSHKLTTYKRHEEPPRNAEDKMICKHIECSNVKLLIERADVEADSREIR